MEKYDIEPFMPAVSPGAPVPAPKYVPFNYSNMTPGNYFTHSIGASDSVFRQFGGSNSAPSDALENIYKNGVKVSQVSPDSSLRATAWNYKLGPEDLRNPQMKKQTLAMMGHPEGLANEQYKSDPMAGKDKIKGSTFIKPRRAAWSEGYKPGPLPRTTASSQLDTVVMRGEPSMFHKKGPNHIPKTELTGNINPKTIIGHFPKGSDQMVTKPGMMTGRMPMIRGFGGAGVDMFSFPSIPPSMPVPHETGDIFGRPVDQGAGFEPEMIPSPGEYDYEIEQLEYPDQGGTLPMKYGPKMIPNPRAGQAKNPYGVI